MNKKDIVLNKKNNKLIYIGIIAVLAVVIVFLIWPGKKAEDRNESTEIAEIYEKAEKLITTRYKRVTDDNGLIKFPVSSFDDNVQYFEYKFDDKLVKFFILKSNDGTIRAAFDACDVCFRAQRGYNQVGDYMQCNNCGMTFPEDKINVVLGGCNPSPLTREVVGDQLVINVESIALGKKFF